MRIIIAGAGEVGTHLAKLLSRENLDVCLMDKDPERLGDLETSYDIITKIGSSTSIRDLKDIGTHDADLFIAVTPYETENMTACLIANQIGAKKTLARIDNYEYLLPENKLFFENMGLNHLIYPEVLIAEEIEESLKTNWMSYHFNLCEGALELCVIKISEQSEIIGKTFKSGIYAHGRYRIVAIKRENETLIPKGDDEVLLGDMIYAVCTRENMNFLREHVGKTLHEVKRIMFLGGSRIAQKAVQSLPSTLRIKIIEKDRELCYRLSEKLSNALIINADGSDMNVLREEGILETDAFVAVTGSSESNIFACLAARQFGVQKTVADVENIDYVPMAEKLDVGTILNKKTLTASYIYQMLMNGRVILKMHNLISADAEIIEFLATDNSRIISNKIKNLSLPKDVNIGAIVRAGEGILVNGDTTILPGDQVAVFCKRNALRYIEKYFN